MNRLLLSGALLLAAAGIPSAARADDANKPKGDLAKIQGKWTGEGGPGKAIKLTITFEGNDTKVQATLPDGDTMDLKGEVRVDDQAKPLKTLDWVNFKFPGGAAMPDRPGIYEFDGDDTLKVCSAGLDGVRPTKFNDAEGEQSPGTFVLKREPKPKDEAKCDAPVPAAAADEPKKDEPAPKGDLADLQGAWTGTVGPNKEIPITLTVKNKAVTFAITAPDGTEHELKGEVVIDDQAKPHKTVDWVKFNRPDGEGAPANLGIYTLKGDTFTVCNGGPGNERPTEFKAGEGGPPNLIVLTKKK